MEEGYRVPTIDEFVQGFEFEVRETYQLMIATSGQDKPEMGDPYHIWKPARVWWKHDPEEIVEGVDGFGNKISAKGATINFFKPFDEQTFLDQGLIRVKIKKDDTVRD